MARSFKGTRARVRTGIISALALQSCPTNRRQQHMLNRTLLPSLLLLPSPLLLLLLPLLLLLLLYLIYLC